MSKFLDNDVKAGGVREKGTLNSGAGLPWWLSGKESICQCRRCKFDPWSGKIPHAWEQLRLCATAIEPVL